MMIWICFRPLFNGVSTSKRKDNGSTSQVKNDTPPIIFQALQVSFNLKTEGEGVLPIRSSFYR